MGAGGEGLHFAYRRSIAPTPGVLLALAIVETIVIHMIVAVAHKLDDPAAFAAAIGALA